MENYEWTLNQLEELMKTEQDFISHALMLETKSLVKEQTKRLSLKEGELDGRTWNPGKW